MRARMFFLVVIWACVKGLKKFLKLDVRPTEKEAIKLAARWAPHRTAASLLLWQANR